MIEAKKLQKRFGLTLAVDDLSFKVKDGEIYGLLGPNGSGKSTTLKILTGILKPSSGKVRIDDVDVDFEPNRAKEIIGYVPESVDLYDSLTPNDLFNMVGSIRGISPSKLQSRARYFVEAFNLEQYLHQYIGTLSFGNKQKVSITSALLHDPSVLIMDEGMNGLDPKIARILREILYQFKDDGKSIIFSTHVLPLAEMVCDRMGLIHEGKIIAEGTVEELKEMSHQSNIEDVFLELTKSKDEVLGVVEALKNTR
ncbi:MAG: ABC transporter ATP-binding protein [Candidatus Saliniplasma sp.]